MYFSCSCHVFAMLLSRYFHVVVTLSSCQDVFMFLACSRQDLAMARAWQDCAGSLKDIALTCTILIETWQNHENLSIESV